MPPLDARIIKTQASAHSAAKTDDESDRAAAGAPQHGEEPWSAYWPRRVGVPNGTNTVAGILPGISQPVLTVGPGDKIASA